MSALTQAEREQLAGITDIYPVGLLADLLRYAHNPDRDTARRQFRAALRRQVLRIRAGEWSPNYINGYLAEPCPLPDGLVKIGHGWTRGRAFNDLCRKVAALDGAQ